MKLCKNTLGVMLAKAGIQRVFDLQRFLKPWIPASAGMTGFFRGAFRL